MLMLLLPKVNKTYHCVCVSRWTRTGKNSPGEWTGKLLWSIWREVFIKAGERGRRRKQSYLFESPGCFHSECGPMIEY